MAGASLVFTVFSRAPSYQDLGCLIRMSLWWASACHRTAGASLVDGGIEGHRLVTGRPAPFGKVLCFCLHAEFIAWRPGNGDTDDARIVHMNRCLPPILIGFHLGYCFTGATLVSVWGFWHTSLAFCTLGILPNMVVEMVVEVVAFAFSLTAGVERQCVVLC